MGTSWRRRQALPADIQEGAVRGAKMDHSTPKKTEAKALPEQADPNAEEDDLITQALYGHRLTAASTGCPFSWRSARNEYKVVPSDGLLSLCIVRVCLVCSYSLVIQSGTKLIPSFLVMDACQLRFGISVMHLGGRQWSLSWHFIFSSV
jgi:hypothetical protein